MSRELLTSMANPVVKQLAALRDNRARKKSDWVRIDGAIELDRALDAGLPLRALLCCIERMHGAQARRALERAEATGLRAREITPELYDKLRYGERDEGLCAAVSWSPSALAELRPAEKALLLVLDGIEKPGNLGAVLRSAEGAGADAVLLCDAPLDPRNPNVVRASLGTLFTLPLVQCGADELMRWLREREIAIACALVDAPEPYTAVDLRGPTALVLGAEHSGLGPNWRRSADLGLRIPMHGRADSLNLSVSAALLLYEARRQREMRGH